MSKEWFIKRNEVSREPIHQKLHNPAKIKELDEQLDEVCIKAKNNDHVQKLSRKIIEEVVNIIQHNDSWNEIAVQSKFNTSGTNFKFRFQYDGGRVFDPSNLDNVVGPSISKFEEYLREPVEINQEGQVTIRLQVKIEVNQ